MTHLRTVHSKLALAAECAAPAASTKERLTSTALTLHVNENYKPLTAAARIAGLNNASVSAKNSPVKTPGNELARTIHYEFVRLGSEFSISEGALVSLNFVPSETDMEEARKILKGLGYIAGKMNTVHPRVSDKKDSVSIWVEYDNADKPYFSKR